MKNKYQKTMIACYLGFITQAITANFAPLLFLTFHRTYQISLGKIAFISTAFSFTQLLIDLFCAKYVDKIGYRKSVVASGDFIRCRTNRTCIFAKSSSRSLCWHFDQCNHLRNGKWSHRSSCQSYCRSMSI